MDGSGEQTGATVLAHGPGWLVVDKPAGMSIHNCPGSDLCSVVGDYLQRDDHLRAAVGDDPAYGVHAAHRLDKETSGLILLACRREVFHLFQEQFSRGQVAKQYLALVHGTVAAPLAEGLWQWPLTPAAGGRANPQGAGRRKTSSTRYRVLRTTTHYTLLACFPLTGRTHQIRRHAVLAGHPLVGDQRYGSLRACRYLARHHNFTRLALHAHALALNCPPDPTRREFESAGLPPEISALLDNDTGPLTKSRS